MEGGSAKLFAGEKATGPVTLDPTAHDQRLWPASFGAGAVVTVPFSVDKYRAGKAQALRIVAQPGSAKGNFLVSIDGKSVGEIPVAACAANEVPSASLLALKEKYFALGDHTLTLTCDMADGDVKLDVVEIAGSWQAGDGTANDTSYDSDTGWAVDSTSKLWADTYYAASMNMKDCAYYFGGSFSALRRDKVIHWNLPKGHASRAKFRLTFRILGGNGAQKPGWGLLFAFGPQHPDDDQRHVGQHAALRQQDVRCHRDSGGRASRRTERGPPRVRHAGHRLHLVQSLLPEAGHDVLRKRLASGHGDPLSIGLIVKRGLLASVRAPTQRDWGGSDLFPQPAVSLRSAVRHAATNENDICAN